MALSVVDEDFVRDAARVFSGSEAARDRAQMIDYTRGVHSVDQVVDRVRREWPERHRRWVEDHRYPSQECVAVVNTGRGMNPEKWRERDQRDAQLLKQTECLAAALERTGVPARNAGNVVAVGLVTGEVEALNSYRKICFLPKVAQRDRAPMLNELRYFRKQQHAHRKYMRMAVVTNGTPVRAQGMPPARQQGEPKTGPYFELRDRIIDLNARIRRFAQTAREVHDVDVVFRGVEFTVKRRNADFFSAHPHANLLYTPGHRLSKKEWAAFLDCGRRYFGGNWWKDCGKLRDPNEAIKYAFKPAELDGLGDAQIRWLFEQTFGLPMAQPMGAFRAWRSDEMWTVDQGADGKPRRRQHRKVVRMEYETGTELKLCSVLHRAKRESKVIVEREEDGPPPENLLLGITAPQRRHCAWSEPQALVMGYTLSPGSRPGQEALDELEAEALTARFNWHRNGAPDPEVALAVSRGQAAARDGEASKVEAFSVHTCTLTAAQKSSLNCGRGPPPVISPNAGDEWQHLGVEFSTG